MVKVGIVGLGFMGQTHIKAYQQIPQAKIVAVCDTVRLPKDGNLIGVTGNISSTESVFLDPTEVKAYRDFEHFINDSDVELVDICVPTKFHIPMSIKALEAGKHVICEKPLARTSQECLVLLDVLKATKKFFMPAMCLRFWPEWAWLKRVIEDQTYGKLLSLSIQRLSEPPHWSRDVYLKGKESGGALLDLHIHDTDFVIFCFGKPKEIYTTAQTFLSGAFDYVSTIYRFENGPSVTAEGSWLLHQGFGFKMSYRADFEHATIDYDSKRGQEALIIYENGKGKTIISLQWPDPDGYVGELRYFVECIEKETPPQIVTAEDGYWSVKICELEEHSALTGKPVEVI